VATLEQLTEGPGSGAIAGLRSRPTDKLVYYAGHDINIYFVRLLLGLNWLTESFNVNQSPPGGTLRARSHCRFAPPLVHLTPDSLTH
jgi:hypothetical protein